MDRIVWHLETIPLSLLNYATIEVILIEIFIWVFFNLFPEQYRENLIRIVIIKRVYKMLSLYCFCFITNVIKLLHNFFASNEGFSANAIKLFEVSSESAPILISIVTQDLIIPGLAQSAAKREPSPWRHRSDTIL